MYDQHKRYLLEIDEKHKSDITSLEIDFEQILTTELGKLKSELEKAYQVLNNACQILELNYLGISFFRTKDVILS